jgi:hypothetical protein
VDLRGGLLGAIEFSWFAIFPFQSASSTCSFIPLRLKAPFQQPITVYNFDFIT